MKTFSPKSSRIRSISYDDQEKLLRVEFIRGGTYEYYDVPSDTYWMLVSGESVGKAFETHIKQGGFEYRKL